jgi:hypothetical protein
MAIVFSSGKIECLVRYRLTIPILYDTEEPPYNSIVIDDVQEPMNGRNREPRVNRGRARRCNLHSFSFLGRNALSATRVTVATNRNGKAARMVGGSQKTCLNINKAAFEERGWA